MSNPGKYTPKINEEHVFEIQDSVLHRLTFHILLCFNTLINPLGAFWLRHCATSWKVAGLRPDEVNEFFFTTSVV
jgi:hypothetical protein